MTTEIKPSRVRFVDCSGTIAANNTAQELLASNYDRVGLIVQNQSSDVLRVNFGDVDADTSNSFLIVQYGTIIFESSYCSIERVTIWGTTAGQQFCAKEIIAA